MNTLLLLVGVCSALPQYSVQQQSKCTITQHCVPLLRCVDNYIIAADGVELTFDLTFLLLKICTLPKICCNIPVVPEPPLTACPDTEVCVGRDVCNTDGNVTTDGSRIIDNSNGNGKQCTVKVTAEKGICCKPPATAITPAYPIAGQCGVRNVDNIIQSDVTNNDAGFGEFPWQAMILKLDDTFICGGSIIGNEWIVTAAHSVHVINTRNIKVRLGNLHANITNEPKPHVEVNVAAITYHPDFNSKNLHNDIAVIKLDKPLDFRYHINALCLPESGQTFWGQRCVATGWGKDTFEGQYKNTLKKVVLPTIGHHQCQNMLQQTRLSPYYQLDESFICAGGEEHKDTCVGDGGGPLACLDVITGRYVLAGITAFSAGICGTKDVPGVYTDVQALLPFVQDTVKDYYERNTYLQK